MERYAQRSRAEWRGRVLTCLSFRPRPLVNYKRWAESNSPHLDQTAQGRTVGGMPSHSCENPDGVGLSPYAFSGLYCFFSRIPLLSRSCQKRSGIACSPRRKGDRAGCRTFMGPPHETWRVNLFASRTRWARTDGTGWIEVVVVMVMGLPGTYEPATYSPQPQGSPMMLRERVDGS